MANWPPWLNIYFIGHGVRQQSSRTLDVRALPGNGVRSARAVIS